MARRVAKWTAGRRRILERRSMKLLALCSSDEWGVGVRILYYTNAKRD